MLYLPSCPYSYTNFFSFNQEIFQQYSVIDCFIKNSDDQRDTVCIPLIDVLLHFFILVPRDKIYSCFDCAIIILQEQLVVSIIFSYLKQFLSNAVLISISHSFLAPWNTRKKGNSDKQKNSKHLRQWFAFEPSIHANGSHKHNSFFHVSLSFEDSLWYTALIEFSNSRMEQVLPLLGIQCFT